MGAAQPVRLLGAPLTVRILLSFVSVFSAAPGIGLLPSLPEVAWPLMAVCLVTLWFAAPRGEQKHGAA